MKKSYGVLSLLLIMTCHVYGQDRMITGRVTDAEDGTPLAGVTVMISGTQTGTTTDLQGQYRIIATPGDILVFTFVGMITQEVTVEDQATIDITLSDDIIFGDEVVITAFGLQREARALGYSITEVRASDFAQTGETNPISSLQGKVAGVDIVETTAGPSGSRRVVIRGINEIVGNNQPLYVIDGVPIENSSPGQATQWGGFDLGDGTLDLNPDDIESISVLKGASASALYGSRALNGVILITTKQGARQPGLGIEINSSTTVDRISTRLDEYQNIYGQGSNGLTPLSTQMANNITSAWGPKLSSYADSTITQADGTVRPYRLVNDNIQDFFRLGLTRHNTVTISTGTPTSSLRFSYSNVNLTDIVPKSGINRNIFTLRGTTQPTHYLDFDARITYSAEDVTNRPAMADELNNIGNGLLGLVPNFDQAWLKTYKDSDDNYINYTGNPYRANPYWTLNETRNESQRDRITGFASAVIRLADPLQLRVRSGIDQYTFQFMNFLNMGTPTQPGGLLSERNHTVQETNLEALLIYNQAFRDMFDVTVSFGGNLMNSDTKIQETRATEIIARDMRSLTNFQNLSVAPQHYRKEIQSVFGFVNIGYRNILYLDFTARNDWSSTLPLNNNSFFYPSVSTSFIISDAFGLNYDWLNIWKLRASWAQVGSDTNPYMLNLTYSMDGRSHLGYSLGGITGELLPNPNLKPQTSTSWEFGTDLRMLNGRAVLDVAYFHTDTDDQILQVQIPETSGYNRAIINSGDMTNRGIELLVTGTPFTTHDFRWDISANYTKIWNRVNRLSDQVDAITIADARWSGVSVIAKEGEEYGQIIGRGFTRDPDGRIVHGSDGMPIPTDSPIELGKILPDFNAGIINTFFWRGFSLRTAFDFRIGGHIYSVTNRQLYAGGTHSATVAGRDEFNDWALRNYQAQQAWVDAGNDPVDYVPLPLDGGFIGEGVKLVGEDANGNPIYEENDIMVNPGTYWNYTSTNIPELNVYDASFIKLRDISIGYNVPSRFLANIPVQGATIAIVGRNLVTLYKKVPNIDPESTYNNSNGQGLEYGSLPTRRHFGINLNFKF
jgi:TonB-linked SusC/RagA family outer membrane protein